MSNRKRDGAAVERALATASVSGIYEIANRVNGKRYIGSAKSIKARWSVHRHYLVRGTHHSPHLQSAWDKYGKEAFAFRILLVCEEQHLIDYEQRSFDALWPEYNLAPRAGRGGGMSDEGRRRHSERMRGNKNTLGYRHSPESLARLSAAKIGNTATKGKKRNPAAVERTAEAHRGMKRSPETRARISAAMRGKKRAPYSDATRLKLSEANRGKGALSEDTVIAIRRRRRAGEQISAIAKDYPVSRSMVSMVASGRRYAWVEG